MENNMEVVDKENLGAVWELVYELVKLVTGNVDLKADGDLQGQIKSQGEEIENLKKGSSDGKSTVAAAITAMGINTAADASFQVIAENIRKIFPALSQSGNVVSAAVNGNNRKELTLPNGSLGTPAFTWNGRTVTAACEVASAGYLAKGAKATGSANMANGSLGSPAFAWNGGTVTASCEVAASGYLAKGTKVTNNTSLTTKGAQTITPGTSEKTVITSGSRIYASGAIKVGTLGGNVTSGDVLKGKTFSSDASGRGISGQLKALRLTGLFNYKYVANEGFSKNSAASRDFDSTVASGAMLYVRFYVSNTAQMYEGCCIAGGSVSGGSWTIYTTTSGARVVYSGSGSGHYIQYMVYEFNYALRYGEWFNY